MSGETKYKVVISEIASGMLVSHARFLAQVSETVAPRLIAAFEEKAKTLEQMPERCPYLEDPILPEGKYRKRLFAQHYLLLFQIKGDTVYVDAMVDCRQNYSWLL